MKQAKTRFWCLFLVVLTLLAFPACGKKKAPADPNLIDLGECMLLYKSACIMEDSAGNDAIVLTLDYTNKEKCLLSLERERNARAKWHGTGGRVHHHKL